MSRQAKTSRTSVAIAFTLIAAVAVAAGIWINNRPIRPGNDGVFHVHPGDNIQDCLEAAAADLNHKTIQIHEGTYRPQRPGQALIWFNHRHDGITLEAIGEVVLTAANPDIASESDDGYPAIVNHVVYFGDRISRNTVLRGFTITGANSYMSQSKATSIQPDIFEPNLQKKLFFYSDGGGIKIFGRSYPTIENVEVVGNRTSPCGAGVSIEHRGYALGSVLLKDCIFRDNSCTVTGSGVDLLHGSYAVITNCLFVGNLSNCAMDARSEKVGKWKPEHGAGALTVFPRSRAIVRNCTFTANRNGVDDSGTGSVYENSIFWMNNAKGGWPTSERFELDIKDARGVKNCFVNGDVIDLTGKINEDRNKLKCEDPQFDDRYVPRSKALQGIGFRPTDD